MINTDMFKTRTVNRALIFLMACVLLVFSAPSAWAAQAPIGSGAMHILGLDVSAGPAEQTVPVNTSTGVKTARQAC